MKFFVLIACFFVVSVHTLKPELLDEVVAKIQEYGIECVETEKVGEADMNKLMEKQMPETHEGKCAIFCVLNKMNIMLPDATFGEGMTEWLTKAKADDPDFFSKLMGLEATCKDKVKKVEENCEKAASFVMCSEEEGTKNGLRQMFF